MHMKPQKRLVLNPKLKGTRNFQDISRQVRVLRLIHTSATTGQKIPFNQAYPALGFYGRLLRG
jgi:hypothetical protein